MDLEVMALEVVGQPVELAEIGDEDGSADGPEDVDAVEEVAIVDDVSFQEVVERHLGDHQNIGVSVGRFLGELMARAQWIMSTVTLVTGRNRPLINRTGRL